MYATVLPNTFIRGSDPDTCLSTHAALMADGCIWWFLAGNRLLLPDNVENGEVHFGDYVTPELSIDYEDRLERISDKIVELYQQHHFTRMFVQKLPSYNPKGTMNALTKLYRKDLESYLRSNGLVLLSYQEDFGKDVNARKTSLGLIVPANTVGNYIAVSYDEDLAINQQIIADAFLKKQIKPLVVDVLEVMNTTLLRMNVWYDNGSKTIAISLHGASGISQIPDIFVYLIYQKAMLVRDLIAQKGYQAKSIQVAGNFNTYDKDLVSRIATYIKGVEVYTSDPSIGPHSSGCVSSDMVHKINPHNTDLLITWPA